MSRCSSSRLLLVLALMSLLGCADGEPPAVEEEAFSVHLMTSAAVSGRWERAAVQGLERMSTNFGAKVSAEHIAADQLSNVLDEIEEPVDVVFCVGPGFNTSIFTAAAAHPAIRFVLLPGDGNTSNVAGIDFKVDGGAFVAGVLAGELQQEPVVGVIRGQGRRWLEDVEEGFVAGFRSIRRRAEVHVASGAEAPWELGRAGVSVALYAADEVDRELLAAALDAGVLLIAVDPYLLEAEPDLVVASLILDIPEAMTRVVREVQEQSFAGGSYTFGMVSGLVDLRLNLRHETVKQPEVLRRLDEARTAVNSGVVDIERLGI